MPNTIFSSRDPNFKKPFGSVRAGAELQMQLHLPISGAFSSPRLLLFVADDWQNPMVYPMGFARTERAYHQYQCTLSAPEAGLYFYTFEADCGTVAQRLARQPDGTGLFIKQPDAALWQLTVYGADFDTPAFLKGGLIYHIFPDRFCNSGQPKADVPADRRIHAGWYEMPDYLPDARGKITNSDYFGGDLAGIRSKLDYLESLGVTCIYLNPIFEAHSNHRYNTANYRKVDPLLGTEDDLRDLCADARAHGIRILLDGVFSHTGDDSIYFNRRHRYPSDGAYNSQTSPYYHWYTFRKWPDDYVAWWDFDTLPNVTETSPDYLDYICGKGGVLEYWLSLGVSGFRLDVADELPDGFLDALNQCVKSYDPDAVVIGEVWEDASNKVAYSQRRHYLLGKQLDSVMNYPFREAILNFIRDGHGESLHNTVLGVLENYPKPVVDVLMNLLSTHDVERAITRLVGEPLGSHDRSWQMAHHFLPDRDYQYGCKLFRLAMVLQYFLPGVPCLYYGDEMGMSGYRDPFNRCTMSWERGDQELLRFAQQLGEVRTKHRGLLTAGAFWPLSYDNNLYAFARTYDQGGLLILVNRGGADMRYPLPFEPVPILGDYHDCVIPALSYFIAEIPMEFLDNLNQ